MTDLTWPRQRKLLRAREIGFNAEVYRHFKDVPEAETSPGGTNRKALRDSILIGAKDSRTTALGKIQYFRDQVQQVHLKPNVYGIPSDTYKETVEFRPEVWMYFDQDRTAIPEGRTRIKAEISFRLMNETTATITEANAQILATAIASEFASGGTEYVFTKGKYIVYYKDISLGYRLRIYATNATERENVVKKVLAIQNHSYDVDKLSVSEPKKNSVNNPSGRERVYDQNVKKRRWRPTTNVRFRYVVLELSGLLDDVILVDTTGKYRDALVKR